MQRKLRARSTAAKLVRKNAIIAAAETLLRQSGYDAMTMQAVAEEVGLAKGTLYLYFPSREILIFDVYGRLFDHWIDRFASHVIELPLDRETYIKGKRAMASRVKKLAGTAYQRLGMNPISAQKFIWGLLTVASGAIQLTMRSSTADKNLPKDVIAFIGSASFETVFLNAAVPLCAGMMQDDK